MTRFNKAYAELMERTDFGVPENAGDLYDDWGMGSMGVSKTKFASKRKKPKSKAPELSELVKCPKCGHVFRNIKND